MEKIIDITKENIDKYPCRCFMKANDIGYEKKLLWFKKKFDKGIRAKQLYLENENKANGFIEYCISDELVRAVVAKNYVFINCLWISPNKFKSKGYASKMIQSVIDDAKKMNKLGIATIASSKKPFIADERVFIKNGFSKIDEKNDYILLALSFKKDNKNMPYFADISSNLLKYSKENIVITYSAQCPWVAKSITEFKESFESYKIPFNIKELKEYSDIINWSISPFSVFNLVIDGKTKAEHYISKTRCENILKKNKQN